MGEAIHYDEMVLPDEKLAKLGIYYGTLKRMSFVQFIEAVETKRIEINFSELEHRLMALGSGAEMDRFERRLWGEDDVPETTQDEIASYKEERDKLIEEETGKDEDRES